MKEAENHGASPVELQIPEANAIVEELKTERSKVTEESLADFAWGDVRDVRWREDAHKKMQQHLNEVQIIRNLQPIQSEIDDAYIGRELFVRKLDEVKTLQARYPEKYGKPFTTVSELTKKLDQHIGREATNVKLKEVVDTIPLKPQLPQQ